ncbi:PDDEXK family nuclease [Nonomuraea wenchangensis]|uniref:Uncharacterized protein n=1 Tax=Nonomuraea wenchangensis TaxID=568860 RepID=A0A1I0F2H6_9ACTN|nr:hypothetical protein [Nonomuraea wenchangensis]SET51209.1 hypothetical protein SAMN05421811_103270 [Nonomuraea wenchangensis]
MNIRAVPLTYNGTTYRSTLEADWAATFDTLGWYYEYEPWAVDLGGGVRYLADFRLPGQNVWCEVKGGHNQRLHKTRQFHKAVAAPDEPGGELVVILRAAGEPGRSANWHAVAGDYRIAIGQCEVCEEWCFTQTRLDGRFCRHCGTEDGLIHNRQYISAVAAVAHQRNMTRKTGNAGRDYVKEQFGEFGRLSFARAPRPAARRRSA